MGTQSTSDPDIDRAIRRRRELNWKVAAKEFKPGSWVVECQKPNFGFNGFKPTAREAWLRAVEQAEKYAKQ